MVTFEDRITGAILGFAIGDALGFPAAGIKRKNFIKINGGEIQEFGENYYHPFFYKLRKGSYTDNTRLFVLTTQSFIRKRGYDEEDLISKLMSWAKKCQGDYSFERWPGETTLAAALRLLYDSKASESGDMETVSCASIYRTLPIGLIFGKQNIDFIVKYSDKCSSYTHNSFISRAGSVFGTLTLAELLKGKTKEEAVFYGLNIVRKRYKQKETSRLFEKMSFVLEKYKKLRPKSARKLFGTGSLIIQTLPLSVFCFLKSGSFRDCVLMAANSFRQDSPEETLRLNIYGWTRQLLECRGGNTDGIAAITGCLAGGFYGFRSIPKKLNKVEDFEKFIRLSKQAMNVITST